MLLHVMTKTPCIARVWCGVGYKWFGHSTQGTHTPGEQGVSMSRIVPGFRGSSALTLEGRGKEREGSGRGDGGEGDVGSGVMEGRVMRGVGGWRGG